VPASSEPIIAACAGGQRLGEIAGKLDAAVGNDRNAGLVGFFDRADHGRQLRHADARDDARGADRARTDADLDTASAPASISALVPSGVATLPAMMRTELDSFLGPRHGVEHTLRMAVRGVDHQQVDARIDQPLGALEPVFADARRRRDAQPPCASLVALD
jgi:hypothetical protein